MLAKIAELVIAKQDTLEEIVLPVGGATLPGEKFVVRAFQTNFHEYNYQQFIRFNQCTKMHLSFHNLKLLSVINASIM